MIRTEKQHALLEGWMAVRESRLAQDSVSTLDAFETIETLRPFLRFVREERIVPVGSHVTSCTLCDTSWLTDKQAEHHEETCILHGIPLWLSKV